MQDKIHYTHCPVCGSATLENVWTVKDQTVSGEHFLLTDCRHCTLRFTQDIPSEAAIAPYYKSEQYISHTNTSKGLINKLYHYVRRTTLVRKRKLLQRYTGLKTGNMLDVGSGSGAFVQEMKQQGWSATGLEPDEDARKVARDEHGLELLPATTLFSLPAASFDAITLWHVLEHVHELQGYIHQLKQLLAPGGKLFIAVPNYTAVDARVYKENWAAYDVPRHLYHFSPAAMKVLMEKHGLRIEAYKPMWYDSFYISLLSSKYKNGKTNWIGAGWNGLRSNFSALTDTKRCSSVIYIISH